MTEQELAEIRQRAEKATPGPMTEQIVELSWSTEDEPQYGYWVNDADGDIFAHVWSEDDMKFVSHSRQDIPALLDEVERLKAALLYYATSIDDGGAIARNALKGGAKLQELIKDAKSMCVICGGPDWTHGARNHEYKGGSS